VVRSDHMGDGLYRSEYFVTYVPEGSRISPLTHHNSISRPHPSVNRRHPRRIFVRYPRKVSFGGGLHLLVSPTGGRYWRYRYRFDGRENLISLGLYPEVPIESARARQQVARQLLALGVNPAGRRKALRQISAQRL